MAQVFQSIQLDDSYLYLKKEDYTESLKFAKIGEKFSKENNDQKSNNYISFLSIQARCYNALGNYPKAIDIANNVYLLRKNSDTTTSFFHHNLANALKNLGDICHNLNFNDCEKYYLNALVEYKQAVGTNHSYYIQTLGNLADHKFRKGDTVNASYYYNLQLSMALKSNEISIEERYSAAIKFCGFLQDIKKIDESMKYINGLINDMESINMVGSNYLNALFILANNYSGLKNHDKSIEINLKIIELYKNKNAFNQNDFTVTNNINYQIASNFQEQRSLELKLEKSKALPSLGAAFNFGYNSFANDFSFADSNQKWNRFSNVSVSLNVPVFSSLGRSAKTQQAKIAFEQAKTQLTQTEQQLKLEYEKAKSEYEFSIEEYATSKSNLSLAERIEKKQQIKFTEGLSSSFDFSEAQRQLYSAQQNYLQSMVNIINKKATLEKLINKNQ